MKGVVIDASVALAWCFPDEQNAYADQVLEELEGRPVVVSSVWALEIGNGLLVGARRKRLSQADIPQFLKLLESLPLQELSRPVLTHIREILPLGREYGLSAYDASYLEAAIRSGADLATADAALERAARQAGISILCAPHPRKPKR